MDLFLWYRKMYKRGQTGNEIIQGVCGWHSVHCQGNPLVYIAYTNSLHKNLPFTLETPNGSGDLAFLDVNTNENEDRQISCQWYQKSTDTGIILNFRNFAPLQHQKNVIQMTTLKSSFDKNLKYRKVYKITCNGCSSIYVSQTSQHVTTKILEHQKKDSHVVQHLVECCGTAHNFEWEILNAFRGVEKLIKIEAIYI